MKRWMGLFLVVLMISANHTRAQSASQSPSLKVVCSVLATDITLAVHLPEGDKVATMGTSPVKLKTGQRYTLSISKEGYTPYKNSFTADWDGLKEKSVVMEKGIGPGTTKTWTVDLENSVTMDFEPIPIGDFMMGSNDGEEDEQPVHRVSFSRPFWMARTEVTNQQYGQYKKPEKVLKRKGVPMPMGATDPVCGINWNDATGFCKWLTRKERREGRLPEGYEYTLPTEAEWEYACRAGSTTEYAGRIDAMGWFNKNSSDKTNPVGLKNPNTWGLHDMHGNVWEWCADPWYATYDNAPTDGSQRGMANNEYKVDGSQMQEGGHSYRLHNSGYRVVRGGSWHYSARACRSANRYYHTPDYKLNYLGFRPILIWNPPQLRLEVTDRIPKK